MERSSTSNARIFWPVAVAVVASDLVTKTIAAGELFPRGIPRAVFGDVVRLTLVYNPGAAFGFDLGPFSRWIFLALTVGALVILAMLYRSTSPGDFYRTLAIALVCGGAIGNLIDRIWRPLGVVDFIDIGLGDVRWPTFNVADMAVSMGAFLLAWVLWGEERTERGRSQQPAAVPTEPARPS
jgi:signal peptidase II